MELKDQTLNQKMNTVIKKKTNRKEKVFKLIKSQSWTKMDNIAIIATVKKQAA